MSSWCFKICCGGRGASSDLKWRGWGYSFPPLVPRHHGYAFRERRCENTATNVFSSFSPALELSILKKNYLYLGTGHYLSAEGGKRILEGISWFLGEYKWESVVTENPKGRIAKKIRRIRKGDQLNLLGKWGLQWSNIQRGCRLNFTLQISLRTYEDIFKIMYVRKNIHMFWCILNKLS